MLYYSATALSIFTNPLPGILLIWFRIEYVLYYNLAFALPSLLYGWFLYRVWGRSKHAMCVQFIGVIQQYAYLSALKDRVLGTSFTWVPSVSCLVSSSFEYHSDSFYLNLGRYWCAQVDTLSQYALVLHMLDVHNCRAFYCWCCVPHAPRACVV